jgi:hypothetical protein
MSVNREGEARGLNGTSNKAKNHQNIFYLFCREDVGVRLCSLKKQ